MIADPMARTPLRQHPRGRALGPRRPPREPGIRVTIAGGRAWVSWDDGPSAEATRHVLVERLLPLAGVEIFSGATAVTGTGRASRCRRSTCRSATDRHGDRLDRAIVPEPTGNRAAG